MPIVRELRFSFPSHSDAEAFAAEAKAAGYEAGASGYEPAQWTATVHYPGAPDPARDAEIDALANGHGGVRLGGG
jgi:hypothetical protein